MQRPSGESGLCLRKSYSLLWLEYSEQRGEKDERSQKKRQGLHFVGLELRILCVSRTFSLITHNPKMVFSLMHEAFRCMLRMI